MYHKDDRDRGNKKPCPGALGELTGRCEFHVLNRNELALVKLQNEMFTIAMILGSCDHVNIGISVIRRGMNKGAIYHMP